jgi:hypothetical protein
LFFKIGSWNFQVQFVIEFRESSQKFNSLSFFRQFLFFIFFYQLSDWVEILRGFTKFNFKLNLKVSAFYLGKQKSFIPKKKILSRCQFQNKKALFTVSIFPKVLIHSLGNSSRRKMAIFTREGKSICLLMCFSRRAPLHFLCLKHYYVL